MQHFEAIQRWAWEQWSGGTRPNDELQVIQKEAFEAGFLSGVRSEEIVSMYVEGQEEPMPKVDATIEELEQALKIDRNHLEEAAEQQPDLFYRVSKELEMAISQRDAAEQDTKVAEAQVDKEIRKKYSNSDERITEAQIKQEIRIHKTVQAAEKKYLELKEACGKLSALKDAFKQRSYAINNLVELYLGNYYSEVKKEAGDFSMKKRSGRLGREAMAEERRRRG